MIAGPVTQRRGTDRARFIGGSDAAKVLGVSPYGTPTTLWLEKIGRAEPERPDPVRDQIRKRGKMLEPYVLEMAVHKLRAIGHDVQILRANRRYADRVYRFMACEIDAELRVDGIEVNTEIKTATGFLRRAWGEEQTDDIPLHYTAQVMHGLGVTQRQRCIVGALVGLDDIGIYIVERDDEVIAGMREKCIAFWQDHVRTRTAPDPMKFADIKSLYPEDNERTVEASEDVAEIVRQLRKVKLDIKVLQAREESLQMQVGDYMRDSAALAIGGRPAVTFKHQTFARIDEAALRRQHPDIAALFERQVDTRVMRINTNFRG